MSHYVQEASATAHYSRGRVQAAARHWVGDSLQGTQHGNETLPEAGSELGPSLKGQQEDHVAGGGGQQEEQREETGMTTGGKNGLTG